MLGSNEYEVYWPNCSFPSRSSKCFSGSAQLPSWRLPVSGGLCAQFWLHKTLLNTTLYSWFPSDHNQCSRWGTGVIQACIWPWLYLSPIHPIFNQSNSTMLSRSGLDLVQGQRTPRWRSLVETGGLQNSRGYEGGGQSSALYPPQSSRW